MDGSAAFDAIAQEQCKKTAAVAAKDNNFQLNLSDGDFTISLENLSFPLLYDLLTKC